MELQQAPDPDHGVHAAEALKVLRLPVDVSRLRWHPFGVYTVPLAPRSRDGHMWSRRLHVWHPEAKPVGEASPYGVHTHSGLAISHVLVGTLHHHLYAFGPGEGWQRAALGTPEGTEALLEHTMAPTHEGTMHTLPKDQPHGVTKPPGLAISLFEQRDGPTEQVFTTWQRTDVPAEPLLRRGPVPVANVRNEALLALEDLLATA